MIMVQCPPWSPLPSFFLSAAAPPFCSISSGENPCALTSASTKSNRLSLNLSTKRVHLRIAVSCSVRSTARRSPSSATRPPLLATFAWVASNCRRHVAVFATNRSTFITPAFSRAPSWPIVIVTMMSLGMRLGTTPPFINRRLHHLARLPHLPPMNLTLKIDLGGFAAGLRPAAFSLDNTPRSRLGCHSNPYPPPLKILLTVHTDHRPRAPKLPCSYTFSTLKGRYVTLSTTSE